MSRLAGARVFAFILLIAAGPQIALGAPKPPLLDPIIVSAALAPAPLSDIDASVTHLAREEIEESGFFFAGDLLRSLPGLSLAAVGPQGAQQSIFLRGHESKHTLVMLDGIPLNAGYAYDFAHISLHEIERVEIIRGPQSVVHGAGAVGGVVNLISRTPGGVRDAALEAGSFASRSGQAYIAGGEMIRFAASAGFYQTDNIDLSGGGSDEKDDYKNHRASFRIQHQGDFGRFQLATRYHQGRLASDIYDFARKELVDGDPGNYDENREQIWHASWASADSGPFNQQVDVSFLRNRLSGESDSSAYQTDFSRRQSEYRISWERGEATLAALGGFERESIDAVGGMIDEEHFFVAVQAGWRAGRSNFSDFNPLGLDINLSARADFAGRQEDVLVWRVALGRNFGALRSWAGYGTAIYDPALSDRYGPFGNPDLGRETAAGWELGLRWRATSGHRAELVWFNENLTDKISYDENFDAFNDSGKSRRDGVESSLFWPLAAGFSAALDYSYIRTRNPEGRPEPRRPKQEMRLRLLWKNSPLALTLTFNGRGARRDVGEVRLKPYHLLAFNAVWQMRDGVSVYLRGENILNEFYQDAVSYHTRGAGLFFGLRAAY